MASSKQTKEYGVLVARIGSTDSSDGKYMSKSTFFSHLEAQYPSSAGWYATQKNADIGTEEYIILAYHMERDLA